MHYPSGTALNNVTVTVRNESSNESKSKNTNSSGEVSFNLGNTSDFPSGWEVGDKFSYVVLYTGYEAYGSHTTAFGEGGFTETVVLTAVSAAPSLKLFTVQEFLDYFNFKLVESDAEDGITAQQIVKTGAMVEKGIENDARQVFDSNSGNYYSQTEYIDTDEKIDIYYLSKIPVSSVTNLYTTQNDAETTPDYPNNSTEWNSLTEGTDYWIEEGDESIGRVHITNSSYQPITRRRGMYVTYKQGRSSVPPDIKLLAIQETGLRMSGSTFIKDKIKRVTDAEVGDLASFMEVRNSLLGHYRFDGVGNLNT